MNKEIKEFFKAGEKTVFLSKSEKIEITTTETAKIIREQLKKEFPDCKFSITSEYFSMGSSISIHLMKAPFQIVKRIEQIPEDDYHLLGNGYTKEDIERRQLENNHQLSEYSLREQYNPHKWNNGVFITEKAHFVLQRAVQLADMFNWNNSDSMTDYFDVNFYLHVEIGKWDKPFEQGAGN